PAARRRRRPTPAAAARRPSPCRCPNSLPSPWHASSWPQRTRAYDAAFPACWHGPRPVVGSSHSRPLPISGGPMTDSTTWRFETQQIHAGAQPDPTTGARATPLYQTPAHVFRDAEHAANLLSLADPGNIYARIINPTTDLAEQPVAAPDGATAAPAAATWRFETQQTHAGAPTGPTTGARATPRYQATAYVVRDAEHAANLFPLAEPGNIYTRIMNPTTDVAEQRIAALEGGTGALLVASGQAAESFAVLNIAQAGDHIVSSASIYGGTFNLFKYTLAKLGIETTFVENQDDLDEWRRAIRPNTKLFFAETVGNPQANVLNIRAVADIAHEAGLPLIVDNTIATPYL